MRVCYRNGHGSKGGGDGSGYKCGGGDGGDSGKCGVSWLGCRNNNGGRSSGKGVVEVVFMVALVMILVMVVMWR